MTDEPVPPSGEQPDRLAGSGAPRRPTVNGAGELGNGLDMTQRVRAGEPIGDDPASRAGDGEAIPNARGIYPRKPLEQMTYVDFAAVGREPFRHDGKDLMLLLNEGKGAGGSPIGASGNDPLYAQIGMFRVAFEEARRLHDSHIIRMDKLFVVFKNSVEDADKAAAVRQEKAIADWGKQLGGELTEWRAAMSLNVDDAFNDRFARLIAEGKKQAAAQVKENGEYTSADFRKLMEPTLKRVEALTGESGRRGWMLTTMTRDRIAEVTLIACLFGGALSIITSVYVLWFVTHAVDMLR